MGLYVRRSLTLKGYVRLVTMTLFFANSPLSKAFAKVEKKFVEGTLKVIVSSLTEPYVG